MALLYEEESFELLGACFSVHNEMGSGFLEAVYHECLAMELMEKGISFSSKMPLGIFYKGVQLNQTYIPDFVVFDKIILEIKAVNHLMDVHLAQLMHYLKASNFRLGFLINFGSSPMLEYKRVIN